MHDDDERNSQAAQFSCPPFPTYAPIRALNEGNRTLLIALDDGACVPVFTDEQRCKAYGNQYKFTAWETQDNASQLADLLEYHRAHNGAAFAVLDPPSFGTLSSCRIGIAIQRLGRLAPPSDY